MDEAALDAALGRQRLGRHGCLPGLPTLVPTLLLMPVYALPALLILSPVFVDDGVAEELLGGATAEAKFKLASVSSAFFAVWGPATLAVSALSDRVGRKPAMLGCAAASSALSFGCAAAPSFAVYAACRACLGGAVGGMGAISYLLATEWSVRADALLLTTALMCGWSLVAAGLAPLAAASSARGGDWRDLQLTISLIQLAAIATGGLALESPRYLLARRREARAQAVLSVALNDRCPTALSCCSELEPALLETLATAAPAAGGARSGEGGGGGAVVSQGGDGQGGCGHRRAGEGSVDHAGGGGGGSDASWCLRFVVMGLCWLAVSVLYYGLDFATSHSGGGGSTSSDSKFTHFALTCLADLPGSLLAYALAAAPRVGRRAATALTIGAAGGCLLVTPALVPLVPAAAGPGLALSLSLAGKFAASAGFVLAYLLPADIFPTSLCGLAIGVANVFARLGTMLAPLCASAPPFVVQVGLGGTAVVIAAFAMVLLPAGRSAATPAADV
mmetsp:Transcript_22213/g.72816  ORF Transcript_22213/g.72816 Transcript_22213/m.72816 type:complete len:505 (+) Transcript_22213:35-1549(+)